MADDRMTVRCPSCAARLKIPSPAVGKRVRCPKCKEAFVAASQASPPSAAAEGALSEDLLTALGSGLSVEAPQRPRAITDGVSPGGSPTVGCAPAAQQDEAVGPEQRSDRVGWIIDFGRAFAPTEFGGRIRLIMVLMGVALAGYGFKAIRLQSNYLPDPKVISCADLIELGSEDNAHVVLTDFVLLPEYLYKHKLGAWRGVWMPAVPYRQVHEAVAHALNIDPNEVSDLNAEQWEGALRKLRASDFDIRLVISFPAADGKDYVERLYEMETLECTVVSDYGIGRLRSEDRKLLEGAYPRSDLSRCRVLQAGQATSLAKARAHQVGGCGLVLLALVSAAWSASRQPG